MAKLAPSTVLLMGDPLPGEAKANASGILPGDLLSRHTSGNLVVHPTAGGRTVPMVAREADYIGRGIDTAFASGDQVGYYIGRTGDRFYMFLEDEQSVAIGALLESNGAGKLQPVSTTGVALFRALEAVNTTGGATATARIKVEVL